MDTVTELLKDTRLEIEREGWVQGHYFGERGGCCLMGVSYMRAEDDHLFNEFARALGFDGPGYATYWNDAPGRTKEEVLARLDAAIQARM